MERIKRFLALIVCAVMIFSIIPMQGFASETENVTGEETVDTTALPQPEVEPAAASDAVMVEKYENGAVVTTTYHTTLQDAFKKHFDYTNNTAMGGTYVVTLLANCDRAEISAKTDAYLAESFNITLDLAGHSIISSDSTKSVLSLTVGSATYPAVFTITDSVGGGQITGGKYGIVFGGAFATLNFNGGTITGNHGGTTGGGICASSTSNQPVVNLNGGMITGNSVQGTSSANTGLGGGVYACQINLNGTIITGNYAYGGTGKYTGRGGGIATPISGTKTYNVVNINANTVYGNYADNAGDDLMIAKNGNTLHTLSIGTENWYIDGWNGKSQSIGETTRYDAENPVAYTAGGFTQTKNNNVGLKYVAPAAPSIPEYTVTYTDGVEDLEIFADQVYTVKEGEATPAFEGTPEREGYTFTGWEPAVAETVTAEVTYVAQWEKIIPSYTVTYTDGVEDEEVFADQVYTVKEGEATPAFVGTPEREGYTFIGWEPAVAETVTAEVTYVAQWEKKIVYVAKLESTGEQYESLQAAIDAASALMVDADNENQTIALLSDVQESVKISWTTGTKTANNFNLTIDLNGFTVTGNGSSVFNVARLGSGAASYAMTVTFNDSVGTGVVTGGSNTYGGAVYNSTAKGKINIVVNGGTWTGNTATSGGGAISSCYTTGTYVYINGGTFTGNTAGTNGGAIYARNLYITGGVITGNTANAGGGVYVFTAASTILDMTGGKIYGNTATAEGDDIIWRANKGNTSTAYLKLLNAAAMNVDGVDGWYLDGADARFSDDNAVEFAVDAKYTTLNTRIALKAAKKALVAPELPKDNGSNVTSELITVICDTDEGHTSKTYGWGDPAANFVFPKGSEPVWNEEMNAWTIGVRIDSIGAYYVGLQFNKEHNGIQHEVVGDTTIDTTLVWDAENNIWQTLTGKPFEVHVTCQAVPEAPSMGYHLNEFKIKLVGTVGGAEKVWHESLHIDTVTVGAVKGNRVDGFTVDVTVTLADGDAYLAAWLAKHADGAEYLYDWSKTEKTVTFTMKYTGDTTGELYDGPAYWAAEGSNIYTAYLMAPAPAAPDKFGKNVTPDLVRVICDTDPDHAPLNISWQFQSTKVRDWVSGVVWSDEYNTWIVPIRIDSIDTYYLWTQYEDTVNEINHDLAEYDPVTGGESPIDTYLKWDETQQLWVTLDEKPIELHVVCKTTPDAPTALPSSAQIQVNGDLDGDGIYGESKADCALGVSELYTTTIPKTSGYTMSEVYGSREEGFFVDVTVTLEDGDIYITNWIAQRAPGEAYVYNWDMTAKTVTFTLKYDRSTTGTLYGSGISDWVANYTGYKVGEAFVIPAQPAAPKQENVVADLVTIICDSDPDRHAPVTGKWYPQHCKTTSDIVWNAEMNTWTVDIRIGSLYIMYVDQLEDANNGTTHELVEDITTVYSTLKWDNAQKLWVPVEPIELHTTCRTAPLAPAYNQVKSYQIKVWGDVNGKESAYTFNLSEDGYTLSEVYGSREEGFFVDLIITLAEDDIYQQSWIEKKNPGYCYDYNWEKTPQTVTVTLKYNGSLTGTLYGDRHASNTNYDWVLASNGKTFGVVCEAYLELAKFTLTLDPNGGNVDPATIEVTYSKAIGELPVPTKTNAIFDGWYDAEGNEVTAETVYNVDGDSTITAKWIAYPGSSSSNVTNELFTIQCTVNHEHGWLCNWFGSHVTFVKDSVKWNEELGRWEAQCKIGSSMLSMINSTPTKKNYFGDIKHYYDTTNYVFDLYYDPNFTGLNSSKKEVTGMWLPVQDYVVPVYCYTEPAMPDVSKVTGTVIWARDVANKNTTHSQKFTVKQLVEGSYTVGQMYTKDGKFYVDITVTDLSAIIQALGEKTGKNYVLPAWENHYNSAADFSFTLEYTGSTTDYKQDGTGWAVAASTWANSSEKNNGKSLWLTEQFTVTYTDGVEGKVFADQSYTVNAYTENGATKNAVTDFDPTATPAYEAPARKGYTFAGWTPEVAATVTADATYTALWTANTYTLTLDANGGKVDPATVTVTFDAAVGTLPVPERTGYTFNGWFDAEGKEVTAETVYTTAADSTVTAKWTANTYTLTLDANGGKVDPAAVTVTFDAAIGTLPVPERAGYTFNGWFDAEGKEVTAETVYTTAADSTVTAKWTANTYTLTLDAAGGTVDPATVTVTFDAAIGTLPAPERTGYTFNGWFDAEGKEVTAETVYTVASDSTVTAQWVANTYTVTFNPNGGAAIEPRTVTFGVKYGNLPSSALTGFSGGNSNWYLVDENGNVTDTKITKLIKVSTARDHELFVVRQILAPSVKVALTVPGGLSDGYKYYDGNPRVLTATVSNMNETELVYSYQWFKDGVAIDGATESVLTLPGNVADSGTYKVVVTAALKDGSKVVVTNESASGEQTQKVQIMRATNTLRLNENYGENPATSDGYWGGAVATIRSAASGRVGYTFAGWNTAADGSGEMYQVGSEVPFPGDNGNGGIVLELYAQWTANKYTITLYPGNGALKDTDPKTIEVTFDAPVGRLPVAYREGYTFGGWCDKDGQVVTADTIYKYAEDITIYAYWLTTSETPSTGDSMTMFAMISMLASAAALLFLIERKRRVQA